MFHSFVERHKNELRSLQFKTLSSSTSSSSNEQNRSCRIEEEEQFYFDEPFECFQQTITELLQMNQTPCTNFLAGVCKQRALEQLRKRASDQAMGDNFALDDIWKYCFKDRCAVVNDTCEKNSLFNVMHIWSECKLCGHGCERSGFIPPQYSLPLQNSTTTNGHNIQSMIRNHLLGHSEVLSLAPCQYCNSHDWNDIDVGILEAAPYLFVDLENVDFVPDDEHEIQEEDIYVPGEVNRSIEIDSNIVLGQRFHYNCTAIIYFCGGHYTAHVVHYEEDSSETTVYFYDGIGQRTNGVPQRLSCLGRSVNDIKENHCEEHPEAIVSAVIYTLYTSDSDRTNHTAQATNRQGSKQNNNTTLEPPITVPAKEIQVSTQQPSSSSMTREQISVPPLPSDSVPPQVQLPTRSSSSSRVQFSTNGDSHTTDVTSLQRMFYSQGMKWGTHDVLNSCALDTLWTSMFHSFVEHHKSELRESMMKTSSAPTSSSSNECNASCCIEEEIRFYFDEPFQCFQQTIEELLGNQMSSHNILAGTCKQRALEQLRRRASHQAMEKNFTLDDIWVKCFKDGSAVDKSSILNVTTISSECKACRHRGERPVFLSAQSYLALQINSTRDGHDLKSMILNHLLDHCEDLSNLTLCQNCESHNWNDIDVGLLEAAPYLFVDLENVDFDPDQLPEFCAVGEEEVAKERETSGVGERGTVRLPVEYIHVPGEKNRSINIDACIALGSRFRYQCTAIVYYCAKHYTSHLMHYDEGSSNPAVYFYDGMDGVPRQINSRGKSVNEIKTRHCNTDPRAIVSAVIYTLRTAEPDRTIHPASADKRTSSSSSLKLQAPAAAGVTSSSNASFSPLSPPFKRHQSGNRAPSTSKTAITTHAPPSYDVRSSCSSSSPSESVVRKRKAAHTTPRTSSIELHNCDDSGLCTPSSPSQTQFSEETDDDDRAAIGFPTALIGVHNVAKENDAKRPDDRTFCPNKGMETIVLSDSSEEDTISSVPITGHKRAPSKSPIASTVNKSGTTEDKQTHAQKKNRRLTTQITVYNGPRSFSSIMSIPSSDITFDIVAKLRRDEIKLNEFVTLRDGTKLVSEVINFYMTCLESEFPSCYFFNSFFYSKLVTENKGTYNYDKVSRWTNKKKFPRGILAEYERIFFPIHGSGHWSLAVIDLSSHTIRHYDSLTMHDAREILPALKRWIQDERNKNGETFVENEWISEDSTMLKPPQQRGGVDCGVFTCFYAFELARNRAILSNQASIPEWRRKIANEILSHPPS